MLITPINFLVKKQSDKFLLETLLIYQASFIRLKYYYVIIIKSFTSWASADFFQKNFQGGQEHFFALKTYKFHEKVKKHFYF